ncbi:hypothetical protein [Pseudoneobacillus rhizosphaerae]|uniref:Uncharacterized protein n=1 Tax=Pseudoneobacillus rhizosphaerae TaxID=2880968 RepID=A0A9C7L9R3_9BACI|nr:hypothetical protein [Pseudoneobacillus rhizosphaerae]CAG9607667.1 hypothetical protein NEOCIP111885_01359 [Pseudoneobacillus rhizosphaerae]
MLNFLRSIDSKIGIMFTCLIATANYYFLLLSVAGILDASFNYEGGLILTTAFGYGLPLSVAATAITAALMREFKKKRKRHINGIIHILHLTIFILVIIAFVYLITSLIME